MEKVQYEGDCMVPTGWRDKDGYTFIYDSRVRRQVRSHRLAWQEQVGPIPPGMTVDHLCKNPPCVNVQHMEIVTAEENARRGVDIVDRKGRTHCPQGHEYTPENTYTWKNMRHCRTCRRERNASRARAARSTTMGAAT